MGLNRDWRRSRLGGSHGSHFYDWWTPKGAAPLKNLPGFDEAPEGSIFLREIRHHDDYNELKAQSLSDHYLPLTRNTLTVEVAVIAQTASRDITPVTSAKHQFDGLMGISAVGATLTRKITEFYPSTQRPTHNLRSSSFPVCFTRIGKGLFHRLFPGSFSPAGERRNTVVMDSRRFRPRETLDSNP
jgi:hypothetical protein